MIQPHRCPVCDKQIEPGQKETAAAFPFCSSRCRSIDLLRWSEGRYAIVEDIDPQMAELLRLDPDIEVQDDSTS